MYKKIILLIFLIFVLTGCAGNNKHKSENANITLTADQQRNIDLQTQPAQFKELDMALKIPAQFKAIPTLTNRIYAPVNGKVVNVFVIQGQEVKAGQALVEIQSDIIGQLESELLQNIIQINSQIKMSQSQLEFARNNFVREDILLKEHVTSKLDWDTAKNQLRREIANLNALKTERTSLISVYQRRLSMYGADSGVIQRVIASNKIYPYITLRSHKNGVVISREPNQEEFVDVNKELFEVADLSRIWLVGNIFEKDIPSVNIGNHVSVNVNDVLAYKGKIIYISPVLDMDTKTLEIRAEIFNDDYKLKPNMYEEMNIKTGVKKVLSVPRSAIQKIGDTNVVYVLVAPYTYSERSVETGIYNDKDIEILKGINENDVVVTQGSFSLLGESIKRIEANY